ncbi:hypothetical protein WR25_20753 isoform B [Diploscapter pachys]|uniref:Complexin n=1 Tax=Diploscapter pachys TaxID=2018661 RepID=A0A2A2LZI1_9BILA|nr:hypothetical protein WR25_20753 isoform B [Diploscapter pachys]
MSICERLAILRRAKQTQYKGGLEKLAGDNENGNERSEAEDPELAAARLEQELRRKEKHRKMEAQRERVRDEIRAKYNIKKKDDSIDSCIEGRIAGNRKTPEQVAAELIQQEEDEGREGRKSAVKEHLHQMRQNNIL